MKGHLYPALLAAMLFVLSAGAPSALAAGQPINGTGAFTQTSFVQSNVRVNGAVTEFDFTATSTVSGTMAGTSIASGHCIVKASAEGQCVAWETLIGAGSFQGIGADGTYAARLVFA